MTIFGAYGVGKTTVYRQLHNYATKHPNNKSNITTLEDLPVSPQDDEFEKETSRTEIESISGIGHIDHNNSSSSNNATDDVWHQFVQQLIELLSMTLNDGISITSMDSDATESQTRSNEIDNHNTNNNSNNNNNNINMNSNSNASSAVMAVGGISVSALNDEERKLITRILNDFQDEACNEYSDFMLPIQAVPHVKYLFRTCDILYENYVKMSQTTVMDNFDYFVSKFLEMDTIQSFWDITRDSHDLLEQRIYRKTSKTRKREFAFRFTKTIQNRQHNNGSNNHHNNNRNSQIQIIDNFKIRLRDKPAISTFRNVRIKGSQMRRYSVSKSRNSFLRVGSSFGTLSRQHRSWSSEQMVGEKTTIAAAHASESNTQTQTNTNTNTNSGSIKPNVNRQLSGSKSNGEASTTGSQNRVVRPSNGHQKLTNISRQPSMERMDASVGNRQNTIDGVHESNTMIFVVSLSDYNRFDDLKENKTINLLYESLQLFYDLCNRTMDELNELFHNLKLPCETNEFENIILFFNKTDQFDHKMNNLQIPFDKQWVFGNKQTVGAPTNLSNNSKEISKLTKTERKKLKKKLIYDSVKAKALIIKKFKNVFEKGKITGKTQLNSGENESENENNININGNNSNNPGNINTNANIIVQNQTGKLKISTSKHTSQGSYISAQSTPATPITPPTPVSPATPITPGDETSSLDQNNTSNSNNEKDNKRSNTRKKLYIWEGTALDNSKMTITLSQFMNLLRTSSKNDEIKNRLVFGRDTLWWNDGLNIDINDMNSGTRLNNNIEKIQQRQRVTFQQRITWNIDNLGGGSSENLVHDIEMSGLSVTKDQEPTMTLDDMTSSMQVSSIGIVQQQQGQLQSQFKGQQSLNIGGKRLLAPADSGSVAISSENGGTDLLAPRLNADNRGLSGSVSNTFAE